MRIHILILISLFIGACTKAVDTEYFKKEDLTKFKTKSFKVEKKNKEIELVAVKECPGKVICTDREIKLSVISGSDKYLFWFSILPFFGSETVEDRTFIGQEKAGIHSVGIFIGHSGHVIADHTTSLSFAFSLFPFHPKTLRQQPFCFFQQHLEDFHQHSVAAKSCTLNGIQLDHMP